MSKKTSKSKTSTATSKAHPITVRDVVLKKQISDDVIKRGKVLDEYTRKIMKERPKRKMDISSFRTKKEKKLLKEAMHIGSRPSESGKKTYPGFHTEPTERLGKKARR